MRAALSFAMLVLFLSLSVTGVAFADLPDEDEELAGRTDLVSLEKPYKRSDFKADTYSKKDFTGDRVPFATVDEESNTESTSEQRLLIGVDPLVNPEIPDASTAPVPDSLSPAFAKPNLPRFDPAIDPMEPTADGGTLPDDVAGSLGKPDLPRFDPALDPMEPELGDAPELDIAGDLLGRPNLPSFAPAIDPMDPQGDPNGGADPDLIDTGKHVNGFVMGASKYSPCGDVDHSVDF